jgi:hypothetical protein
MKEIIETLRGAVGKAQFASILYRTKTKQNKAGQVVSGGELARYTLVLGATYLSLIEKSRLALELMPDAELNQLNPDAALVAQAKAEVLASLDKSIAAHKAGQQSEDYTKRGLYESLGGGLNINSNDGTLQLFGLVQSKVVVEKGIFKLVNSAPLTIVKNQITKLLPVGKFREFALDMGNIRVLKMDGDTLTVETEPTIAETYQTQGAKAEAVLSKGITPKDPNWENSEIAALTKN